MVRKNFSLTLLFLTSLLLLSAQAFSQSLQGLAKSIENEKQSLVRNNRIDLNEWIYLNHNNELNTKKLEILVRN